MEGRRVLVLHSSAGRCGAASREREGRKVECNSFRGGNKGMGKSEEWVEVEAHRVPCACHGFTSL